MKASKDMIVREIAGNTLLIPTGKVASKLQAIISFNESGLELWNLLKEEKTINDMMDYILQEYEVDPKTAEEDVQEFINQLNKIGLLEM